MPQQLSTELQLDALLSSGYEDAFSSASDLMSDLKKESADLRKQLMQIGKEADAIEKVGDSAEHLRTDMRLLERQINETNRAQERFGEARSHFRRAGIGARALGSDIKGIGIAARNAVLAIAGIGTAAAVALSPDEELLAFDQTLAGIAQISPEVDAAGIEMAKSQIRELSNQYGISAAEIAQQHQQLTRNLGFEGAQETISASVAFQTATGLSITDFEEELATARISLGIDTPAETQQFLELLQQAHQQGIKIDNLDLGDMETLMQRTGEDVFGEGFQREFLTTIAFRQVDSFQFADYSAAFQEDFERSTVITMEMETDDLAKAQENVRLLERYSLRAEDGILGAMRVFQELSDEQQALFREQLAPVLGEQTVEVIARGSEALPRISEQVDNILASERSLQDAALGVAETWSGVWRRIGVTGQNSLAILREQFADVFGPPILALATRFYGFLNAHQDEIRNFFTGIRDGISPVISKIWAVIQSAYPDIRAFAFEVFGELQRQWQAISPYAQILADGILNIAKAVGSFLKEHPALVATVISGAVAWKAYSLASSGVAVASDLIKGSVSLVQGHMHRLNATILENARVQGTLQSASLSISKVFGGIGRAAFGALPGIGAMGAGIWAAVAPALPIILPVVAAVGALGAAGYIVYRNWEPIKAFFVDNFETIRTALMFVFPPLGLLVGFAGVIKQNWEPIKEFFSTLWETVRLAGQVAWEGIQFLALSGLRVIQEAWWSSIAFFQQLWGGVVEIFTSNPLAPVFEWMVEGVKAVFGPLTSFFSDFWDNVAMKAGEVIDWITDKFEWFNNVLQDWLGWLRTENEKLRTELEVNAGTLAVEMPELTVTPSEIPRTAPAVDRIEVPAPDIQMPAVPPMPEVEQMIQSPSMETPSQQIPTPSTPDVVNKLSAGTQRVSVSTKEIVDVSLGILSETRKQTLLMENFNQTEVGDAETSTVPILPKVEIPTVEVPQIQSPQVSSESPTVEVINERATGASATDVKLRRLTVHKWQLRVHRSKSLAKCHRCKCLTIEAPQIDSPQVAIESPQMEVISEVPQVQVPEIEAPQIDSPQVAIESPQMEVISEVPQVQVPEIEAPQIDSPQVAIESPQMEVISESASKVQWYHRSNPHKWKSLAKCHRCRYHRLNPHRSRVHRSKLLAKCLKWRCRRLKLHRLTAHKWQSNLHKWKSLAKCHRLKLPQIEAPSGRLTVHRSKSLAKVPQVQVPEIEAPQIESPQVAIESPQMEVISEVPQVQVPQMEAPQIESPSVEVLSEMPQMDVPEIEAPQIESPQVAIESPQMEVISEVPQVQVPQIESPQIESPSVEVIGETPQMDVPEIEAPQIESPQVAIESPQMEVISEVPQVQVPQIESPQIESPSVEVIGETPQMDVPEIEAPQIESPQVAIESPQMEVISEMPQVAIEQTPIFDMPELAMQMPPIESPSVEIETPQVQVSEIPALEMPEVQVEAPTVEIEDLATPAPADVQVQQIQEEGESETAPAPVTLNTTINIYQQPGEDSQEFAERVVEVMNRQRETMLVQ